jgi:RNA polymerase sigma-54 factor
MAIKLSQNLKQTQNLMLTPQLQQSIKMLTLDHSEITELISNELVENPLLEDSRISEGESPKEEDIYNASLEKGTLEPDPEKLLEKNLFEKTNESFDWQGYMEASGDSKGITNSGQVEREESFSYENIVSQGVTLAEHLRWQLRMEELTPEDWEIADFIIGNINDEGYLEISSEEIAQVLQTSSEKVLLVLERIHELW